MSQMLKNLKKKDGKADPKKDPKKEKQPKKEVKKQKEEEQEQLNDALVELNYDEKSTANVKNTKKIQSYKLEEKEIDTANIVIEKKEEKKAITSWVVEEKDIKNVFRKDFDATKCEQEFGSLTNQQLNKQLEELAKKKAEIKPAVQEKGGFKFAALEQQDKNKTVEPELALKKPGESLPIGSISALGSQLAGIPISPPTFTNSAKNNFVPLEKTPQQLRQEELQKKMQAKISEPVVNAKGKGGWLGTKQPETKPAVSTEFKLSGWATKGIQAGDIKVEAPAKFAPLEKSQQEKRFERQEQQYVFVSKKDQEERRLKREEEAKKGVAATKP